MATAAGESFDTALVSVPFESLRRTTRERKYAIDELSAITAELAKAASENASASAGGGDDAAAAPQPARELLSSLTGRLRRLKRSLEEASRLEELDAARVRARIEHVASGSVNGGSGSGSSGNGSSGGGMPERGSFVGWTRARFDRMVADDLARRGRGGAAQSLRNAVAAEGGGLDLLVDWDVYAEAEPALEALTSPSSSISNFDRAEPAVEWCRRHAARLKKLRSPLPFRLRLQQFVELALNGGDGGGSGGEKSSSSSPSAALAFAKEHLAPQALGDKDRLSDLQRGMLLLVVLGSSGGSGGRSSKGGGSSAKDALGLLGGGPALRSRYGDLLSGDGAWRSLASLTRAEVARVHEMASRSQLSLQVAAGLIALKPPPGAVFDHSSSSGSGFSGFGSGFSGFGSGLAPAAATAKKEGQRNEPSSSSSRDDPLSSASLSSLASTLPHARRLHSQLVCGLTGKKMDDANPPAALPCGATFSESGLRALAGADGCVECPLHGVEREGRTPLAQLRRVFVS